MTFSAKHLKKQGLQRYVVKELARLLAVHATKHHLSCSQDVQYVKILPLAKSHMHRGFCKYRVGNNKVLLTKLAT